MFTLVTPDGKYHGTGTEEACLKAQGTSKHNNARLLSDEEWAKVVANPDKRAELCGSLGKPV